MTWGKGFRTFAFAALGAAVGGIAVIQDPNDWRSWAILVLSAVMAGMRAITDTPPKQS